MDALTLYSRGFMGSRKHGVEIAPFRKKPLHVLSLFDLKKEDTQKVVINDAVALQYERCIRKDVMPDDFDYREIVIRIALRSFGTMSLSNWLLANLRSPAFSQLHADFVSDTINFVRTGKRVYPIQTWERMIHPGANDPNKPSDYTREAYSNLGCSSAVDLIRCDTTMLDFIHQWVCRHKGFVDLLYTLNILFGEDRN